MGDEIETVLEMLSLSARPDLRAVAIEGMLGYSADKTSGPAFFKANPSLLTAVIGVTADQHNIINSSENAWLTLTNLAAFDEFTMPLLAEGVVYKAVDSILDKECKYPDVVCMMLGNLTRSERVSAQLAAMVHGDDEKEVLPLLVEAFCRGPAYNSKGTFHYLAHVLFNVSQTADGRQQMMLKAGEGCILQRLLPFMSHASTARRAGVIGCIRNCCFSVSEHMWLLGPDVDVLPHLLLPIIGGEELDEEDMDGMPDDLQYMAPDKEREPDADLRKMLVESLMQLAVTADARIFMRESKVYPVLREYHKWEPESDVKAAIEELVHVMITPEMETALSSGDGNLRDLEVPEAYTTAKADVNAELEGSSEAIKSATCDDSGDVESESFQVGAEPGYYLKNRHKFVPGGA